MMLNCATSQSEEDQPSAKFLHRTHLYSDAAIFGDWISGHINNGKVSGRIAVKEEKLVFHIDRSDLLAMGSLAML